MEFWTKWKFYLHTGVILAARASLVALPTFTLAIPARAVLTSLGTATYSRCNARDTWIRIIPKLVSSMWGKGDIATTIVVQYSKTCVKRPLSNSPEIGFRDQLSLNAGKKYCWMLQGEHLAILLTFIKLPIVIKIFVLSIFEIPFYTGFYCTYLYVLCWKYPFYIPI